MQLVSQVDDQRKQVSAIAPVEVRSAIRRRQRAGEILPADADSAITALIEEFRRTVAHPVTGLVLEYAAGLVDRQDLRALDSLQLAAAMIAQDSLTHGDNLQFVASDIKLLEAAKAEGLNVWDPSTT